VWVPRHCGIHGNEEADALARAGPSSAFVGRSLGTFECQAEGEGVVT
jgi:ribonuclease HI